MGSARARLLKVIKKADRHQRFRIYTPVTLERNPIYVHAKVLVVDDCLLRVGSSNLNKRSMGFDTECDLPVEAPATTGADTRRRISAMRDDLLAEHLGVRPSEVGTALRAAGGSLIAAIEAQRSERRSLVPFEPPDLNAAEDTVLSESNLLDPERPSHRWRGLNLGALLPGWFRSAQVNARQP